MSSTLRIALRSRLTIAMRARDRGAIAVLRNAVAAIENAEAVPVAEVSTSATTSGATFAGSTLGVGATEARRRVLDDASERALVVAEVAALVEAEQAYAAAGDPTRARSASDGVAVLKAVLSDTGDGSS
ncbi:MAG TPA: hypothetical protein VFN43_02100 [Humibacillus sp.]|nr:hypothetical protein [Humibacillus sp.]